MRTLSDLPVSLRIGLPFALFSLITTIALLVIINRSLHHHDRVLFQTLAENNAAFLRSIHLPASDRFAAYLSEVLQLDVRFYPHHQTLPPAAPQTDRLVVPYNAEYVVAFTRPAHARPNVFRQPETWTALLILWMASLGLAFAIIPAWLRAERQAMLARMATQLAHEIQNPVAAIRLHSQLADPTAWSLVRHEADRIRDLVNQWLYLTRPSPPQTSRARLRDLVAEALRQNQLQADHAGITVHVDMPDDQIIEVDQARFIQALSNLVRNAIQAMPNGGTLELRQRRNQLLILDTGPGFSSRALRRATRWFYSEREGGIGVGLAVARAILHAAGGRLQLTNRPEGGACVCLTLPRVS